MTSQEKYIKSVKGVAIAESIISGIPPSIKIAQSIVETGWGKSAPANNYFGVKSAGKWSGPSTNQATTEYFGSWTNQVSSFRAYVSRNHSFIDHSIFLHENDRYDNLFDLNFLDYKAWANTIKADGYATGPNYANTLIDVIEKNNLHEIDKQALFYRNLFYAAVLILVLLLIYFVFFR